MKYKIHKRENGSYRVQPIVNGRRISLTFDHKPSQAEIEERVKKLGQSFNGKLTFERACHSYIDSRTNTISPSTLREYKKMVSRYSDRFLKMNIDDITQQDIQLEINRFAKDRKPKTVRNYHGFLAGVMKVFRPDFIIKTTLPEKEKKDLYIPKTEDIQKLLEYAKGTPMEVAIYLGCASLRRGEVCALRMEDIDGNVINVRRAVVLNPSREWTYKRTKNYQSTRHVTVPWEVIDAINRVGLYNGHPNSITDWMSKTERKLGLNHFSFHKLRHYFASMAHKKGVPDVDIMKAGGWKTDNVMKTVYRHSLEDDTSKATAAVFTEILDLDSN